MVVDEVSSKTRVEVQDVPDAPPRPQVQEPVERRLRRSRVWVAVSAALMLVSMIGASIVQTSGGAVTVKDLRWETSAGIQMSGLLFVPDGVSADDPAPAVVVSHGMLNSRGMQDQNFVELSRRGYVVLSMDMYSHGESESVADIGTITTGMYQAVSMIAGLDYVDTARIGITGHSLGGMSSNVAVQIDNGAGTDLISAVLLNSADATYVDADSGDWTDIYGSRDVGIMAGQYDEFFFEDVDADGDATATRDFVQYANAQSFLNFGDGPAAEPRVPETLYEQTVDGESALRVIYNPAITHALGHFSSPAAAATIEFFDEALGAPNPIPAGDQVWQWKEAFNLLGLIGLGIFLGSFPILLLNTRFFGSLRATGVVTMRATDRVGRAWLWGGLTIGAIIAGLVFMPILSNFMVLGQRNVWAQNTPSGIAMWAGACGLVAIATIALFYFTYGRRHGFDLAERGVTMPMRQLGKTVALAILTVAAGYGFVFLADYLFETDFRIWLLSVKTFSPGILWVSLFPAMVLMLVFYISASVATNSMNFVPLGRNGERREWVNTAVLAVFNVAPPAAILLVQYTGFFTTGFMPWADMAMPISWLIPFLVILPVTTVISRKIYRVTNNPYLGGIINGVAAALITCGATLTWA